MAKVNQIGTANASTEIDAAKGTSASRAGAAAGEGSARGVRRNAHNTGVVRHRDDRRDGRSEEDVGAEAGALAKGKRDGEVVDRRASNERRKTIESKEEREAARKEELTREEMQHQQAIKKRLLASCERIHLLSDYALKLEGYPDNWSYDMARKTRDVLLMAGLLFGVVFIVGLGGIIPAVFTGLSLGVGVLLIFLAFSPTQSMFTNRPSLWELSRKRAKLVANARANVMTLEGDTGLAWRCQALGKYNKRLYHNQYSALVALSKQRSLANALMTQKHFAMYAMYMKDAKKGYKTLQREYLNEGARLLEE